LVFPSWLWRRPKVITKKNLNRHSDREHQNKHHRKHQRH
jgi:hypothetical protein